MDPTKKFQTEIKENIASLGGDSNLRETTFLWIQQANIHNYTYNFSFLSRPIIQYPQDMVAMQELIWHIKPDLIIETGIAHGGSLIMSASMLAMLDYCQAVEAGVTGRAAQPS